MLILLTKGYQAIIDDEDYSLVSKYKWHAVNVGGRIYAQATIWKNNSNRKIYMHRLITTAPEGKDVDHANHNTLDNRKINLRICTRSQNFFNRLKGKSLSIYKGVSQIGWTIDGHRFTAGKWRARIKIHRKEIYLGTFKTEEEAALAYDAAALKYFGNYACLNLPDKIGARSSAKAS